MSPISSYHDLKNVRRAMERLDSMDMLSPTCRASAAINEIICNYSAALDDIEENTQGGAEQRFALTQTYDGNLSMTRTILMAKASNGTVWTAEVDIIFQFARLNLYAHALIGFLPATGDMEAAEEEDDNDLQTAVNRQIILFRGVEAALVLISQFRSIQHNMPLSPPSSCSASTSRHTTQQHQQQQQQQQHTQSNPLLYYPRHFFEKLFFTAMFLFRALMLDNGLATPSHRTMALQGIRDTHEFYLLIPQSREFARAARWVEALIEKAARHEREQSTPTATTSLFAAAAASTEASILTPPGMPTTTARTAGKSSNSSSGSENRLAGLLVTNRLGASIVWDTNVQLRLDVVPKMYKPRGIQGSVGPPADVGGGAAAGYGVVSDNNTVASSTRSNGMGVYTLETTIRVANSDSTGETRYHRGSSDQVDELPMAPDMKIESSDAVTLPSPLAQQDFMQNMDPGMGMEVGGGMDIIDPGFNSDLFWDISMVDTFTPGFNPIWDQQIHYPS
jgi:hypothetical protein